jgi:hypothetical protein
MTTKPAEVNERPWLALGKTEEEYREIQARLPHGEQAQTGKAINLAPESQGGVRKPRSDKGKPRFTANARAEAGSLLMQLEAAHGEYLSAGDRYMKARAKFHDFLDEFIPSK